MKLTPISKNPEPGDTRKHRSDSVLKTKSQDFQDAIANYAVDHSLTETREWLARRGLRTSQTALSNFLSWYKVMQQQQQNGAALQALVDRLQYEHPDLTPEEVQMRGQMFFTAFAIEQRDFAAWLRMQQFAVRREKLSVERDALYQETCEKIINTCNDPKVRKIAQDSKKTYAEKVREIREIMFGKK